jgi:hypothetical protein
MIIHFAIEFAYFFALALESHGIHHNEGMVLSLLFLGILTIINIGLLITDNAKK